VVIHRAGGHEELRIEHVASAEPGPGEVRIRTSAAGINFADCLVRMGLYASAKDYVGWPITPGFEVAGTVDRVGPNVRGLSIGERVLGVVRFGGYAEEVVTSADLVRILPSDVTFEEAAGFPAVHLTAYFALFELVHPRRGDRVLVHSAAGGVGGALVQLAKHAGCEVVAVVGSAHKVATATLLGADHVIDKASQDLWSEAERLSPKGYSAVFDANGVETLKASYEHLASPGKLVVYGFHTMLRRGRDRPAWPSLALAWARSPKFDPLRMTQENRSVLAFNLSYLFERREIFAEAIDALLRLRQDGVLRAQPITTFRLSQVAEAHAALESGTTVGKLVLTI
jgi:synaptic vesicle membrane protein VAT-1